MRDEELHAAGETVRQRLMRWLERGEHDFEDLRVGLQISGRRLEEELRHVERTARGQGKHLKVTPPRCSDCGFDFPGRARKHLHVPGRCPKCHGERIEPPSFRVAA